MNLNRSSPLFLGITSHPHLLLSLHALPKPRSGDLPIIEDYVDNSDSEFGHAEVGGSAGGKGQGDRSPNPGENAGAEIPKAPCLRARKCRASSQSNDAR